MEDRNWMCKIKETELKQLRQEEVVELTVED